jgi:ABC-2 type transport system ATP-binding protein/ribosome-dependent ATPase
MTGEPLARCQRVTKRFGQFTAVREVDLEVGPGEIVGLLGANGAGKTTLIRLVLGLVRTSAGEVMLFGEPPSRRTRGRIGYVPQGLGLYDDLSPAENMQFTEAIFGARRHQHSEYELPDQLRPYAAEMVGSLPLGVQRRIAFAQALSHRPELLILDEPTSGVDPLGRARLWETIAETADKGAGVLVTTHYMEEAEECGRLVVMADGGVVAEGTSAQIVGAAQSVLVEAQSWSAAFNALESAGLQVALAGRALRVPDARLDAVREALGDLPAVIREVPATLEERFFQLTSGGAAAKALV